MSLCWRNWKSIFRGLPKLRRLFILWTITLSCAKGAGVTLSWQPSPSTGVVGYAIYYGIVSGVYTQRVDVGNQTSAAITGLTAGVSYYFAVTAYTTTGLESEPSNEVDYTVPPPSTNQVVAPYITQLTLSADGAALDWTTITGRNYRIYCSEDLINSSWFSISPDLLATGTTLHWLDTSASTNSRRFYSPVLLP